MDSNDEETLAKRRRRRHLIRSAAAIAAGAVATAVALDSMTKQSYRGETLIKMNSNQMEESPDVPEIDPMLDLDNEDEAGYNEIPTPQSEFSSRRRGRPCGGSSISQQSKKKMTIANSIVEPLNKLADAIERSSDGVIERKFAEEINQALFEMYDIHSIDKVAIAMGFLMKNKWAATSVLSTPKEKRVTLLDAIMRTSTSNP